MQHHIIKFRILLGIVILVSALTGVSRQAKADTLLKPCTDTKAQAQPVNNSSNGKTDKRAADVGKIAFFSSSPAAKAIFSMYSDGTGRQCLLESSSDLDHLAWSPNGKYLAFVVLADPAQIYVMNADGSGAHVLASKFSDFVWMPDSAQIAYSG